MDAKREELIAALGRLLAQCDRMRLTGQPESGAEKNARAVINETLLLPVASDLLREVELQYIELADLHNNWPGRHTTYGQAKLCRLRDLICKATGRDTEDVQSDYSNRAADYREQALRP